MTLSRPSPNTTESMPASIRTVALPTPSADAWDWQLDARCRGADSAVFFSPDGERGRARAHRVEKAKAICRRCPVLTACRAHALNAGEPYGVWGALDPNERLAATTAAPG